MAAPPDLSKLAIDAQVRLDLLRDVHADFMRHLPKVEDADSERIDSKAFAIDRLRTQNRITVLRSDMSFLPYRLQQVKIDQLSEADLRRFTLNLTHLLDLCERFVDEAAFDVSQIPEDEQRHDAPLSRFPKLLAFRQSLQLVKQEAADDTTSIRQIAATTTLYNVAKKCSDQFEELVSALRDHAGTGLFSEEWSYDRFVGLRNSFIYWADYLGALAPGSSSLDTRLDNHADIRLLVWELLAMVDRNIGYIAIVLKSPSDAFEEAQHIFPAVDSAISRLHSLARAIRRSSRKETDVTSLSVRGTEHEDFRRFALAYVQRLFPAARLSLYEHMSNFLTMRRVALLRMQQHAQDLAEKQEVKPTDASDTKPDIQGLRQATAPSGRTESKAPPRNQIPASKIHSPASIVTRDLPKSVFDKARFREFYHKTSTVPVASSSYSRQDDKTSSDYPPPPQFKGESGRVPCTFCREPIQINSTNLKKKTNEWTKHVDRDLQPYTCLFPRCNQLLFQHFSTWKDHMITIHSQDWYRKVHTTTWICDIGLCQKTPQTFNTEDEWKAHMRDTEYHRPPPTELQLKALSVQKQKRGERSAHQCPFCESVPEEISKLRGRGNPSDVSDIFMRHIGAHVKFLSLIALPVDGGDGAKSAEFQDSERRLRKTGSDASLPSGAASLAQISLRFTDPPDYLDLQTPWTGLDDDNMLSLGDDEPVPELHETFRWDYVWGGHSSGSKYGEMDVSNDNIIQHMISNMSIAQITALESIADLDRGVAISKKALYDTPPDHPDQAKRLRNVETWLVARFKRIGKIDDLDQVIQLIRDALHMMKLDNPDRASHLYNLGSWLEMRFQRTGELVDLEEAISVTTEALDITPLDYPGRAFHRHNLVAWHIMRYQRTGDEDNLDQVVRLERDANNVPSGEYPALATISNSIGNQLGTQFVVPDLPDPELEQTTEAASKTAPENEPRQASDVPRSPAPVLQANSPAEDGKEHRAHEKTLAEQLRICGVLHADGSTHFWPMTVLKSLLTEQKIRDELVKRGCSTATAKRYTAKILSTEDACLKIFAILVLIDRLRMTDIEHILSCEAGIRDKHLPLDLAQRNRGDSYLSHSGSPWHICCSNKLKWSQHTLELFFRYQWRVNVPTFGFGQNNEIKHQEFDHEVILPWCREDDVEPVPAMEGGYGKVVGVRIHEACHNFHGVLESINIAGGFFAIKKIRHHHWEHFREEVKSLKRFDGKLHKHFVALLATFRYKTYYYMILPWAEHDLEGYLKYVNPTPNLKDIGFLRWLSKQCLGLAGAVSAIHYLSYPTTGDRNGLHENISMKNILWYSRGRSGGGMFAISNLESISMHRNTELSITSYIPPDYDIDGEVIPRASDIWTLGCLYLELLCWLLMGNTGRDSFESERLAIVLYGEKTDVFFDIERWNSQTQGEAQYVFKVKDVVSKKLSELHANERCTPWAHELLDIVENEMLVVLANSRSTLDTLLEKLLAMDTRCQQDEEYCLANVPDLTRLKQWKAPKGVLAKLNDAANSSVKERSDFLKENNQDVKDLDTSLQPEEMDRKDVC